MKYIVNKPFKTCVLSPFIHIHKQTKSYFRTSLAPPIKKYRRNAVFLFAEKEMRIIK